MHTTSSGALSPNTAHRPTRDCGQGSIADQNYATYANMCTVLGISNIDLTRFERQGHAAQRSQTLTLATAPDLGCRGIGLRHEILPGFQY